MSSRWTWHGGGLAAARAHYGDGDWLDLSTGINPHAWPHAEALAIDWRRLPDEDGLHALEAAAAHHFGADPAHVCAVPGTEIGLRLTGELLPGPAHYLTPTYRTHAAMIAGASPLAPADFAAADGASLILANPNTPDGRAWERAAMLDLLARRGRDGWLIVDEAFADTAPAISLAAEVGRRDRLILFRSFGKFFGLAGLRLGFVIAPPAIGEAIRGRLGAWPLSAAAIAIGRAAYTDTGWIAEMRGRLVAEAQALDAVLARRGLRASGACPLFRLVDAGDAMGLFDRLARRRILTRPFDDDSRRLRIGLPASADDCARLDAALGDG